MKTTLNELLKSGKPVITDGAMGTMLFAMGFDSGDNTSILNLRDPDKVRSVHRQYINAGARIIITNSFVANRPTLARYGYEDKFEEINKAAAVNARAEADASEHPVLVGGDIGSTGEMLAPLGTLTPEAAEAAFAEQAAILSAGGADVFWIETFTDKNEAIAAVKGCQKAAPELPVVVTMSYSGKGRTIMGDKPEDALDAYKALGVAATGANCGEGPAPILIAIEKMRVHDADMPLVARANAGLPRMVKGETVFDGTPEVMAEYALKVRELGANIIGACCGSTPFHIKAIADALGV